MVILNIKAVFIIYIWRINGPLGLYIPFKSSNQVVQKYTADFYEEAACFIAKVHDATFSFTTILMKT